jgi:hypothetical protein
MKRNDTAWPMNIRRSNTGGIREIRRVDEDTHEILFVRRRVSSQIAQVIALDTFSYGR